MAFIKIPPVGLLLVLVLIGVCVAFDEMAKFRPQPLRTVKDCKDFAASEYRIAKANVYYHKKEKEPGFFYLDSSFKGKLDDCCEALKAVTKGSVPGLFYHIKNVETFTQEHRTIMVDLNSKVLNHMDLIPTVKYYLGPKGKASEIAKGLTPLYMDMALAAAESETLTMAYNQAFFDALNRTLILDKANTQYLVLNGWHLRNMDKPPVLRPDFNQIYSAIVIWVDPKKAFLISKFEARQFLNGTFMPLIYDMPGSPEGGAAALQVMKLLVVVGCFVAKKVVGN